MSRVRSNTMVCIVSSTTKKLMTTPRMTKERMNGFSSGKFEDVIKRAELRHGPDLVGGQQLDDLLACGFGIALAAHKEHRSAAFGAGNILRRLDGNEVTRAFAVQNDAANGEFVAEEHRLLADVQFVRLRGQIVDDGLIRAPGTARRKEM